MLTLDRLRKGESAIIEGFSNYDVSIKLMELGCNVGEQIFLDKVSPWGDPISVSVSGYTFSIRKKEAASVTIKLLPSA